MFARNTIIPYRVLRTTIYHQSCYINKTVLKHPNTQLVANVGSISEIQKVRIDIGSDNESKCKPHEFICTLRIRNVGEVTNETT